MACNAARSAAFAPPQAVIRVQRKLHFHTTAQLWYLHTCGASNSLSEATSYRCISSGTSYEAYFIDVCSLGGCFHCHVYPNGCVIIFCVELAVPLLMQR